MSETKLYILRARVIEGSLPMPKVSDPSFKGLQEDNFEIICEYTKENLRRLFEIGKEAYQKGDLTKMEIMGWAGGVANTDGDRFLWSFRPDKYNFEHIPASLLDGFDSAKPRPMDALESQIFDRFWRSMKYGFSLRAYESSALRKGAVSLTEKIQSAESRMMAQARNVSSAPERDR